MCMGGMPGVRGPVEDFGIVVDEKMQIAYRKFLDRTEARFGFIVRTCILFFFFMMIWTWFTYIAFMQGKSQHQHQKCTSDSIDPTGSTLVLVTMFGTVSGKKFGRTSKKF